MLELLKKLFTTPKPFTLTGQSSVIIFLLTLAACKSELEKNKAAHKEQFSTYLWQLQRKTGDVDQSAIFREYIILLDSSIDAAENYESVIMAQADSGIIPHPLGGNYPKY